VAGVHGYAIGVDFGTSTSFVAEQVGRRPVEIAPLGRTTRWLPSLASYHGETILVGEDAESLPADQVLRSIKRSITENRLHVQVAGPNGVRTVLVDEVVVAILAEIARRAESAGRPITFERELRLGCPAMWDGEQRQRLLDLAAKAGLPADHSGLVDEPVAAGVAWVTHRFLRYGERPEGRLLVFDMGGGTLDIAVLDVVGGERPEIAVLSALGTTHAGDLLDETIAGDLEAELGSRGVDVAALPNPLLVRALLLRAAREAKVALTRVREHRVVLPRIVGQLPVVPYSREQMEEAFQPQMRVAEQLVWAAVRAARLTERGNRSPVDLRRQGSDELAGDINFVLLAGGMCRIPYVERRIGALFPGAQVFDSAGVEPDEAIVAGLAATTGYERINLHRPGIDFVVEWNDGGQRREATVYHAYTPLYEPWQAMSGQFDLGYERYGRDFPGPGQGNGVLRVRTPAGEYLGLKYEGQDMDGIQLTFGRDIFFKLYCDGRIVLRDGAGRSYLMRVDRWPRIMGRDYARLVLRTVADGPPAPPTPWYLEKEWAPPAARGRPRQG
jgi:molecular chaperone DnaK (HSP70)